MKELDIKAEEVLKMQEMTEESGGIYSEPNEEVKGMLSSDLEYGSEVNEKPTMANAPLYNLNDRSISDKIELGSVKDSVK